MAKSKSTMKMQTATLEQIQIPHGCVDGHDDDVAADGSVESSQEVNRPQRGRQGVPPDGDDDYYYYDYDCCVAGDDADADADGDFGGDDDSVLDVAVASLAARAPTDVRNDDVNDGEFYADAVVLVVD